jgi:hypothetical protein
MRPYCPVDAETRHARLNEDVAHVYRPSSIDDSVTGMQRLVRGGEEPAVRGGDVVALRDAGDADEWVVAILRIVDPYQGGIPRKGDNDF